MKDFIMKRTQGKGLGLFALRDFEAGEGILHHDLRKLERYSLRELAERPELDENHTDYVGHGKYVVDYSPSSYMNHSCDPNCYVS